MPVNITNFQLLQFCYLLAIYLCFIFMLTANSGINVVFRKNSTACGFIKKLKLLTFSLSSRVYCNHNKCMI